MPVSYGCVLTPPLVAASIVLAIVYLCVCMSVGMITQIVTGGFLSVNR